MMRGEGEEKRKKEIKRQPVLDERHVLDPAQEDGHGGGLDEEARQDHQEKEHERGRLHMVFFALGSR